MPTLFDLVRHWRLSFLMLGAFAAVVLAAGVEAHVLPLPFSSDQLPPTKVPTQQTYAQMRAYGLTHRAPKDPQFTVAPVAPPPPLLGGVPAGFGRLYSDTETIRPPGDVADRFTDSWTARSAHDEIDVWAGAKGSDPSQGFLLVAILDPTDGTVVRVGTYLTPEKAGVVRITMADGAILRLTAANGAAFSFDTSSLTFR